MGISEKVLYSRDYTDCEITKCVSAIPIFFLNES